MGAAFGVVRVLDFGRGGRWMGVLFALVYSSMRTCYVEKLFRCLFAVCTSSLVSCLFGSLADFLIQLFIFLLWSFKNFFCIMDNCPLSDVFCKYCLPTFLHCLSQSRVFNFNEV